MDLDEEAVWSLRDCARHRPCEAREVGLIFICEDPRLVRAMAIPATGCSSKAARNVPEMSRKFTKDVNINGTNLTSPLESIKVPKKRTQKTSKRGRKMCQKHAKKHKQTERATPKGVACPQDPNPVQRLSPSWRGKPMALLRNDLPSVFFCQLSLIVHWLQVEKNFFRRTMRESCRKQSPSLFGMAMKRECC